MLTLTRKAEYAVIAMAHLGRDPAAAASAREIAEQYNLPAAILASVLKQLQRSGMLRSIRGARGGYTLDRNPERVTLLDVLTAVDGPVRLVRCAGDGEPDADCGIVEVCPVRGPLGRVHEKFLEFVGSITVRELAGLDSAACACGQHDQSLKVLTR